MKSNVILETERLELREMMEQDAGSAYLLNLDPAVIQYTGDEPFESIIAAGEFLRGYTSYRIYGFGHWAVIRKVDSEFLGWCGLKYQPENDEFDIGFRFFKKFWNHGYATEAAKVCLRAGFERWEMPEIFGNVQRANVASQNVLEKIGLKIVSNQSSDHQDLKYVISRADYFSHHHK